MPKRPKSHQLESASILALQARLPPQWVYREERPDYGIDGSIEVFDPDGTATGLRCLVQLKSRAKGAARPSVRIRRETGNYYRSLDVPVLIVLYEEDRKRLLVRWFHEFDPFYGGLGKREITFVFREEHAWSAMTADRIETDLRALRVLRTGTLALPVPVQVSVVPEHIGGVSRVRMEQAIRREFRNVRNLFREAGENAILQIRVETDTVVASFRGRHSISLHLSKEELAPESFAKDVLLLVSVVAGRVGDHGLAATIAGRFAGRSKLMRFPETASYVTESIVRSRKLDLLLDIAEQLLEDEESLSVADALMMVALMEGRNDQAVKSSMEEHLRKRVTREEAAGDSVQLGTVHYNLANWLRGQGRSREALQHYRRAAEVHPAYAERDYYYRDVGGVLFNRGFYRAAAHFYAEAVRRGGPPGWKALQADALFFAGSFDSARETLGAYLAEEERPDAVWILKMLVLDVIAWLELPTAGRRTREAKLLVRGDPVVDEEFAMRALKLDPLCPEAWLRLGAAREEQGDHGLATTAAITAAVVVNEDPELWAQAFLLSGHSTFLEIGQMIAFAALESVKDAFAPAVLEFAERVGLPAEEMDTMAQAVGALEGAYERSRRHDTYELRFTGREAAYEKVVVPLEVPFDAEPAKTDVNGPDETGV
jgi:tetratricopeptide (TPR) repeat protein